MLRFGENFFALICFSPFWLDYLQPTVGTSHNARWAICSLKGVLLICSHLLAPPSICSWTSWENLAISDVVLIVVDSASLAAVERQGNDDCKGFNVTQYWQTGLDKKEGWSSAEISCYLTWNPNRWTPYQKYSYLYYWALYAYVEPHHASTKDEVCHMSMNVANGVEMHPLDCMTWPYISMHGTACTVEL